MLALIIYLSCPRPIKLSLPFKSTFNITCVMSRTRPCPLLACETKREGPGDEANLKLCTTNYERLSISDLARGI